MQVNEWLSGPNSYQISDAIHVLEVKVQLPRLPLSAAAAAGAADVEGFAAAEVT